MQPVTDVARLHEGDRAAFFGENHTDLRLAVIVFEVGIGLVRFGEDQPGQNAVGEEFRFTGV